MRRFLVIEDDHPETLVELLQTAFPSSIVRFATTVSDAMKLMEAERQAGRAFDVVVVDLKLPETPNEQDKVTYRVHPTAKGCFADAIVAIYSAYLRTKEVEPNRLRTADIALDKNEVEAPSKLVRLIREELILRGLRGVFGGTSRHGRRCLTTELAVLTDEVEEHYDELSDEAKAEIEQYIEIKRAKGGYTRRFHRVPTG